jgi:hypothetical protein
MVGVEVGRSSALPQMEWVSLSAEERKKGVTGYAVSLLCLDVGCKMPYSVIQWLVRGV